MLFEKELDHLRQGAQVIAVLDELNRASAKYQVLEMAAGRLEPEGARFIANREANIDRDLPQYVANQLDQVRKVLDSGVQRPKTFDEVLAMLDAQVPQMLRQQLGGRVTLLEARELHARLDVFPALRSTVRADLHLWLIPLMHGVGGGRDKSDDYRHVIEASYADVFITGDEQLARTVPRLNPALQIVTWHELVAGKHGAGADALGRLRRPAGSRAAVLF